MGSLYRQRLQNVQLHLIEDIPPGARINDVEIAAAVSTGLAAGLVTCSQVMGKCLREDVGMLFGQFHMKSAGRCNSATFK